MKITIIKALKDLIKIIKEEAGKISIKRVPENKRLPNPYETNTTRKRISNEKESNLVD